MQFVIRCVLRVALWPSALRSAPCKLLYPGMLLPAEEEEEDIMVI